MAGILVENIVSLRCSPGTVEVDGGSSRHTYGRGSEVLVGRTATGLLVEVNNPGGSAGASVMLEGPITLRLPSPVFQSMADGVESFPPQTLMRGDSIGGCMLFFGDKGSDLVSVWDNSQPPQTIN